MTAEEQNFILLLKKGNDEAFRALVERFSSKMYGLAMSVTRKPPEAEEIVQDVFVKVFTTISTFRGESSLSTWIYRLTYNMSIDAVRRSGRRVTDISLDDPDNGTEITDTEYIPEDVLIRKMRDEDLRQALMTLPDRDRMILQMKYVVGMSYEDICAATGLNEGTLKSGLNRARSRLRKKLQNMWNISEDKTSEQ